MPYKVIVFGPEHAETKNKLWDATAWQWKNGKKLDQIYTNERTGVHVGTIQLMAPYVICFADRAVDDHNSSVKRKLDKGHPYGTLKSRGDVPTKSIEVGMFATILTGLCMENNLSVSYTLCFPSSVPLYKLINDDLFLDIDYVILWMSIGYAGSKNYILEEDECKPPMENIIEWR